MPEILSAKAFVPEAFRTSVVETVVVERSAAPETFRAAVVRYEERFIADPEALVKNTVEAVRRVASTLVEETFPKKVVAETLVASILVEETFVEETFRETTLPDASSAVEETDARSDCPDTFKAAVVRYAEALIAVEEMFVRFAVAPFTFPWKRVAVMFAELETFATFVCPETFKAALWR